MRVRRCRKRVKKEKEEEKGKLYFFCTERTTVAAVVNLDFRGPLSHFISPVIYRRRRRQEGKVETQIARPIPLVGLHSALARSVRAYSKKNSTSDSDVTPN